MPQATWNGGSEKVVSGSRIENCGHTTCGYSPYEGMTTDCTISKVFLRGQLIAKDNVFLGQSGYGRLLPRKRVVPYERIIRL